MEAIEFPEIKNIDSFVEVSEEADEALKKSRGVLEEQEQEIQDLEKQIKYHGKIIRGE